MDVSVLLRKIKEQLEEGMYISHVIDVGDCYAVTICNEDGRAFWMPPYAVDYEGNITGDYPAHLNPELAKALDAGKVLYERNTADISAKD